MHLRKYVSRTRIFWAALSVAAVMTVLLAACGAESSTGAPAPTATTAATPTQAPTPTPTQATNTTPNQVVEVTIVYKSGGGGIYSSDSGAFQPATITIPKGGQVVWTNKSTTTHSVISDNDAFTGNKALRVDETFKMTFNTAGTFTYHCNFHSDMTATITVT